MSEISVDSDRRLLTMWLIRAGLTIDQITQRLGYERKDVALAFKEHEIADQYRRPWDPTFIWTYTFRVYLDICIQYTDAYRQCQNDYDNLNPERRWHDHGLHRDKLESQFLGILEECLEIPPDFWDGQTATWRAMINSPGNRANLSAEIHRLGREMIYDPPTIRQAFADAVKDGRSRNPISPRSLTKQVTTFLEHQYKAFTIAFEREHDLPDLIEYQFKIWSATQDLGRPQCSSLFKRNYEIFCLRLGIFGYDGLETNVAIGRKFGITGSRVAEIIKKYGRIFRHPHHWPAFVKLTWGVEPRQLFFW